MIATIPYPNIDPVMLEIGPIAIRWYGLAYVAGFIVAGLVTRSLIRRWKVALTDDDLLDIVLAAVIGLVAGARIGYVVFYGVGAYWDDPLSGRSVPDVPCGKTGWHASHRYARSRCALCPKTSPGTEKSSRLG